MGKQLEEDEIWQSYRDKPRIIDEQFLEDIPWERLQRPPDNIVAVIRYMRDVEMYSHDIFFDELMKTPSGRDPILSRFIERWSEEEARHGELFTRMLRQWQSVDCSYRRPVSTVTGMLHNFWICLLENACGEYFKTLHMVWGAINELATKEGYRALLDRWDDPVFTHIVRAIVQEEGRHAGFYLQMARLRLHRSPMAARFCRRMVERFWRPVGQWDKQPEEIEAVMDLFRKNGFTGFEENVSAKIQQYLQPLGALHLTSILKRQMGPETSAVPAA